MTRRRILALAALASLAACDSLGVLSPAPRGASHPGFDAAAYPGDAAMAAWRVSSPYEWAGYYLPAPCHHDVTWSGTRSKLQGIGWGLAVIYVGQQTWEGVANVEPQPGVALRVDREPLPHVLLSPDSTHALSSVTCSRTLLSSSQGASEGSDAVARTAAEGFANGTTIFLDVEYMATVTDSMRAYVRGWTAAVLADGRFRPGVYVALRNADDIRAQMVGAFASAGRFDYPPVWITISTGFSLDRTPDQSGRNYAAVWQGAYDRAETWGGYPVTVDQNVSAAASPSEGR